jgi:hypothetical protein
LANGVSAVDVVLDVDVKEVKQNSESEADSCEMISPEHFLHGGLLEAGGHADEEERHHGEIAVIPYVVKEEVCVVECHWKLFWFIL